MRTLIVHNAYGKYSGEEAVVDAIKQALESRGQEVSMFRRSSEELADSFCGKLKGFAAGVYSRSGVKGMREALERVKPDVVNVHNVFPLISPAALFECKEAGVPVIMTIHNYRLICPTGLFMRDGRPCEDCLQNRNEWNCVKYNCEHNWGKSIGYALRNYVARQTKAFADCVDAFSCITDFQREKLIEAGFSESKIKVNPNFLDVNKEERPSFNQGEYVAFCGRLSHEKGYDILIEAARKLPSVEFRFAGAKREAETLPELPNIKYLGYISGADYQRFVSNARFIVMPSRCYEGFPMAILEAAAQGKSCIGPDHGGFSEIIGKGATAIGKVFEPGNIEDLAQKVRELWDNAEATILLGKRAYEKLCAEYSSDRFYERFLSICQQIGVKNLP
ncbi:MAG: glycosyltransferase family 4 protein [Bacteroidaceae bacterium]|nr:glycosyltransferase family 4 protein [Bacteroidaceae bacterium]